MNNNLTSVQEAAVLERYKYVLDQKKNLASATFKILAVYQAVLVSLAILQFSVFKEIVGGVVSVDLAVWSCWVIYWMHLLLCMICVVLLVSGLLSWSRYKGDEAELEVFLELPASTLVGKKGKLRLIGWFEVWIIFGILTLNFLHLRLVFGGGWMTKFFL